MVDLSSSTRFVSIRIRLAVVFPLAFWCVFLVLLALFFAGEASLFSLIPWLYFWLKPKILAGGFKATRDAQNISIGRLMRKTSKQNTRKSRENKNKGLLF